jgi:hypothetical protein
VLVFLDLVGSRVSARHERLLASLAFKVPVQQVAAPLPRCHNPNF